MSLRGNINRVHKQCTCVRTPNNGRWYVSITEVYVRETGNWTLFENTRDLSEQNRKFLLCRA